MFSVDLGSSVVGCVGNANTAEVFRSSSYFQLYYSLEWDLKLPSSALGLLISTAQNAA